MVEIRASNSVTQNIDIALSHTKGENWRTITQKEADAIIKAARQGGVTQSEVDQARKALADFKNSVNSFADFVRLNGSEGVSPNLLAKLCNPETVTPENMRRVDSDMFSGWASALEQLERIASELERLHAR